jgi:hypothetical protein
LVTLTHVDAGSEPQSIGIELDESDAREPVARSG